MYQETPFTNPYVGSISDLILRPAEAQAAAVQQAAAAQAQAKQASGQAYGGAIAGGAQAIGQGITALNDPNKILADQKAQELKQQKLGRMALANAIKQYGDDHEAIAKAVTAAGFPDQANAWLHQTTENKELIGKLSDLDVQQAKTRRELIGDLAYHSKTPQDLIAGLGVLASTKGSGVDEQTAHNLADELDSNPDSFDQIKSTYQQFSPKWQDEQKELKKVVVTHEGDVATTAERAQQGLPPLISGGKKLPTSAPELAYLAAQGDATAKAALDAVKPPKTPQDTTAEMEAKYILLDGKRRQGQPLSSDEKAFIDSMNDFRTVPANAAADAAEKRQAQTEAFNQMMAGKKELTEKTTLPYQQARSAAQTLRDTVTAAQNGNKLAASLQSLETTLDTVRSAGLNRLNATELGATGNAGSLYDNIRGYLDKKLTGQPIPADIQKDMLEFSNILEKGARQKYSEGYNSIVKSYGLKNEPTEQSPEGVITVKAPDGTIHDFASQEAADKFKTLAGIK